MLGLTVLHKKVHIILIKFSLEHFVILSTSSQGDLGPAAYDIYFLFYKNLSELRILPLHSYGE